MASFIPEQVLALAPDASSAKAGRGLASPSKWLYLKQSERAIWGECQGSGKDPYRAEVDLTEPAFKCTCPSHKFPCKHGLGLLLLFAEKPAQFAKAEPAAWVVEWLAKRDVSVAKKTAKAEGAAAEPEDPEAAAKKEAARVKRAANRDQRVKDGLGELDLWISDLVRQGLAHARQQPIKFWYDMAARMVDAQAPGLARRIKGCASAAGGGGPWAERLLARFSMLHLLIEASQRMETLPAPLQADIRTAIGYTQREEDLVGCSPVHDRWQVQGVSLEEEDALRVQRTWLRGWNTGKAALVLSFAPPGQPLDVSLPPAMEFEGDLVFYPSQFPLRALVKNRSESPALLTRLACFSNLEEAMGYCAEAWALNPWQEQIPLAVANCRFVATGEQWILVDSNHAVLPLARTPNVWQIQAGLGGHPGCFFGEWDGTGFILLSMLNAEGQFTKLGGNPL